MFNHFSHLLDFVMSRLPWIRFPGCQYFGIQQSILLGCTPKQVAVNVCCVGGEASPQVWVEHQWQECWWPQCTRLGRGGAYQRAALNFQNILRYTWAALRGTSTIQTTRWATFHILYLTSEISLFTFSLYRKSNLEYFILTCKIHRENSLITAP